MFADPPVKIHFVCFAGSDRYEHIRQLTLAKFQVVTVPLDEQLSYHSSDPLVAVNKSVIGGEAIAKAGDFLYFRGKKVLSVKRLEWGGDAASKPA